MIPRHEGRPPTPDTQLAIESSKSSSSLGGSDVHVLDDEMLTIEEVATYLKLKPQTIYKWAQTGRITGAKFGKEWRFRRSTIEEWIDDQIRSQSKDASGEGRPMDRLTRTGESAGSSATKSKKRVKKARVKKGELGPKAN